LVDKEQDQKKNFSAKLRFAWYGLGSGPASAQAKRSFAQFFLILFLPKKKNDNQETRIRT
jgi:hypothetical protein